MLRWLVDKLRNRPDEGDSSPGVLLSSGYIAGGSIAALLGAAFEFLPQWKEAVDLAPKVLGMKEPDSDWQVSSAFFGIGAILLVLGIISGRSKKI